MVLSIRAKRTVSLWSDSLIHRIFCAIGCPLYSHRIFAEGGEAMHLKTAFVSLIFTKREMGSAMNSSSTSEKKKRTFLLKNVRC